MPRKRKIFSRIREHFPMAGAMNRTYVSLRSEMARFRMEAMAWGAISCPDTTTVFIVGDVSDSVEAVFDGPVTTDKYFRL